jgi:hypothetical protein
MRLESVDAHGREMARVLQRSVRRLRLQRACVAASFATAVTLVAGQFLTFKTAAGYMVPLPHCALSVDPRGALLGLFVALPVLSALAYACLRVDRAGVARCLDRAHGLHDTLQAALEVSGLPAARRSAFGAALLRQADALAPRLSLERALPLRVPRAARGAAALALLVWLGLAMWPRGQLPQAQTSARTATSARLAQQGERAKSLAAEDELGPEQPGTDLRQREIVRALRAGEISQHQAIGALLALERELRHADAEQPLRGELLERLAELVEGGPGPSPRKLESAAEVLRDPASSPEQREQQRRLIEEKRRELEKLRGEHAKSAAERREREKLSRQLGGAAKSLAAGRPEQAASQLEAAAQEVRKQAAAQRQREQQKGAAEAAAQLRERLQRQRSARGRAGAARELGQLRREQEQHFAERAEHGEQLVPSAGGGSGDPAAPSPEPSLLGREPRPRVSLEDHATQSAQGDGPSRSEVVMSAADRGFADEGYRKVYADYRGHAEAVLEQDQVPSGYRYYVRRYFQLIRPRTGAPQ